MERIICSETSSGLNLKFRNDNFKLKYPLKVWKAYPDKKVLIDNLTNLLTISFPIVAGIKGVKYNTSMPLFYHQFRKMILGTIPQAVEDYKINTAKKIKEFMNMKYVFNDNNVKFPNSNFDLDEKAIIPLSCGKDSLTTLGVVDEIGLKPECLYINDTVSPTENNLKLVHIKKVAKEFKLKVHSVTNQVEQLNDFEYWDKKESLLPYMHMMTGFCFISLPFLNFNRAKYVVLGNQKDMDNSFVSEEGYLTYPSFDQTMEWTKEQDKMIQTMINGRVCSVIEPLTNIAITKILNERYPKLAKYQVSCDCLNVSKEKRWCHDCNKCARLYLFMKAVGADVRKVGYHKNLFKRRYKGVYRLFNGREVDHYEKSVEAREQQLLAFYMAYKAGEKGELIDMFKKLYLKEAVAREDELYNKFLKIQPSDTMPKKIKNKVLSIYKEAIQKDL